MSKKLWSLSTTVRNPYRVKGFLSVLSLMEGEEWNRENQRRFQILLIQNRLYSPEENDLSREQVEWLNDPTHTFSWEQAEGIFDSKNYEDPPMRGRTSYKPLEKAGLTFIVNKKIVITDLGKRLLAGEIEIDDFWFRTLLQWQYPNPLSTDFLLKDGYDVKPFVATLLLIRRVNELCRERGLKEKGISRKEFGIFALSLINYRDIDDTAEKLLEFRAHLENLETASEQADFLTQFTEQYLEDYSNYSEGNLRDYTDNAIRYFRLTKYVYIRGGGYYIDLEPRRVIELQKLFQQNHGGANTFSTKEEFIAFMCHPATYYLPWENVEELTQIATRILEEIRNLQKELGLGMSDFAVVSDSVESLKQQITQLRAIRTELQDKKSKGDFATLERIQDTIQKLQNIRKLPEKPSLALEKYILAALKILNDAIRIKTNAPTGDDNELTFTAPANISDMECEYQDFGGICEVTMLTGRDQWYNEGQPVMRHLRDYEQQHPGKPAYCLFVSPSIHRDTINTFWNAIKYDYEGEKQRIIPLSITQIIELLGVIVHIREKGETFRRSFLKSFYDRVLDVSDVHSSSDWRAFIENAFHSWKQELIS